MSVNVLRVRRTKGFTVVPDEALRDNELSFKARGLLAYLLSMPDGWDHGGARGIAEQSKEGRDAILTGLQELEDAGYLHRNRKQVEGGKWSTEWVVADSPSQDFPAPENPDLFLIEPKKETVGRADTTKRKTRIPEEWEPSDADLAWCERNYPTMDPWQIAREFRTYWLGRGDTMAEWGWAFRNRVQQLHERQHAQRGPGRTHL